MTDPSFIQQTGEFGLLTMDQRREWITSAYKRGESQGCTFARVTVDDPQNPNMAIVEGWLEQPKDQGHVRWQLMKDDKQ